MLRCSGGSVRAFEETSRSPTWISPSDGSRKPAISRRVVVLPQPEGPSRQTSCPWSTRKLTSSTTTSEPKRLVSPRNSTDATRSPRSTGVDRPCPGVEHQSPGAGKGRFHQYKRPETMTRHARPRAGHPRLSSSGFKDVDGRDEPGHGEVE